MLLVDEPSEGLAPQIVADVGEALARVAEEIPVLLVEQNLRLALDLADRFYVLDHGQVVDEGDADEVDPESERLTRHLSA
jgi:branched-chain amino acid transport system ATP-binding protein